MSDHLIAEDVSQFILEKIDSVAEMEGLLLLKKNPEQAWNAEMLAKKLYVSEQQAHQVLVNLSSRKLLVAEPEEASAYRYEPKDPALAEIVERTQAAYSSYLIAVTNLIHSKSEMKIKQFADAFKLKKRTDT